MNANVNNINMSASEKNLYDVFVKYTASLIKKYGPDILKKNKKKKK